MSFTIQTSLELETINCCNCGVVFAVPQFLKRKLLDHGGEFFCPNGHSLHFKKPTCVRLREELEQKQKELTAARCETLAEKQRREKSEAKLLRHQKRTKNGVCPCCQRSFLNLQRHLATKHPSYGK